MGGPGDTRASIAGRVTTTTGQPIGDAVVMITAGPSHPDIAALTSENGEFRMDDLLPGLYTITVNTASHGVRTGQLQVRAGEVGRLDLVF
jgi:protocatechuate 3,4-dioxygenase beta subunit